jgi:hypothetical protein
MLGELIKKWGSCQAAGEYLHVNSKGLSGCAKTKYRFYGGYIWSFSNDLPKYRIELANNPIKRSKESRLKMSIAARNRIDQRKSILQYDLNNIFIKEWDSSQDAIKAYNFSSSGSISECLHNKRKTAFGYVWKFKNKP